MAILIWRDWLSSSFLRHYDETQSILKSQPQIWALGADGEHVMATFLDYAAKSRTTAPSKPRNNLSQGRHPRENREIKGPSNNIHIVERWDAAGIIKYGQNT